MTWANQCTWILFYLFKGNGNSNGLKSVGPFSVWFCGAIDGKWIDYSRVKKLIAVYAHDFLF
jgi:hypothetical protein